MVNIVYCVVEMYPEGGGKIVAIFDDYNKVEDFQQQYDKEHIFRFFDVIEVPLNTVINKWI